MAIASLALGAVSLLILPLGFCCGCVSFLTLVFGIAAAALGYVEVKRIGRGESSPKGRWMALVGAGAGALACVLFVIWIIVMLAIYGMAIFKVGPYK
jgi:hypothetical protein